MSQKTGFAKFTTVIGAYSVIYLVSIIISAVTGSTVIIWLPMIFAFLVQLALRLFIVKKENINDCGSNPMVGEFCMGFWCWYCSVTQSNLIPNNNHVIFLDSRQILITILLCYYIDSGSPSVRLYQDPRWRWGSRQTGWLRPYSSVEGRKQTGIIYGKSTSHSYRFDCIGDMCDKLRINLAW